MNNTVPIIPKITFLWASKIYLLSSNLWLWIFFLKYLMLCQVSTNLMWKLLNLILFYGYFLSIPAIFIWKVLWNSKKSGSGPPGGKNWIYILHTKKKNSRKTMPQWYLSFLPSYSYPSIFSYILLFFPSNSTFLFNFSVYPLEDEATKSMKHSTVYTHHFKKFNLSLRNKLKTLYGVDTLYQGEWSLLLVFAE